MKGIILSGGLGTRLSPLTTSYTKQLLPVYDKPMIYYPLTTLMSCGIRDILIITSPDDDKLFKKLFSRSSLWGVKLKFAIQKKPKGIADSFIIASDFIKNQSVMLILGDNIFNGINYKNIIKILDNSFTGAHIFAYKVEDPKRYGVIELKKGKIKSIIEKPIKPKSNYAVTGFYIYDKEVVKYAKNLKLSKRGELEITDINKIYLKKNTLNVSIMDRGSVWLDAGTFDTLLQSAYYVQTIQKRQKILIGSPEEVAYLNGWISKKQFAKILDYLPNNDYKKYLEEIIK